MSEPGELETLELARKAPTVRPVPLTSIEHALDDLGQACDARLRLGDPLGVLREARQGCAGRVTAGFCEFRSTSAEAS